MASEGSYPQSPGLEHLAGPIERVTFHSPETGFAVLQVKVRGHRDLVTVVATLASATAGEWLDAHGRWSISAQYGQQFRAETVRTSSPSTPEGIEKFLGSGLIRGIGPTLLRPPFNLSGALLDPFLEIYRDETLLREIGRAHV